MAAHLSTDCTAGAIACTTAAVLLPQDLTVCILGTTVDHKYLWLCFALALWGLGQGAGPVVEALLADSTRTGQLPRPEAQTQMQSIKHQSPFCAVLSTNRVLQLCQLYKFCLLVVAP